MSEPEDGSATGEGDSEGSRSAENLYYFNHAIITVGGDSYFLDVNVPESVLAIHVFDWLGKSGLKNIAIQPSALYSHVWAALGSRRQRNLFTGEAQVYALEPPKIIRTKVIQILDQVAKPLGIINNLQVLIDPRADDSKVKVGVSTIPPKDEVSRGVANGSMGVIFPPGTDKSVVWPKQQPKPSDERIALASRAIAYLNRTDRSIPPTEDDLKLANDIVGLLMNVGDEGHEALRIAFEQASRPNPDTTLENLFPELDELAKNTLGEEGYRTAKNAHRDKREVPGRAHARPTAGPGRRVALIGGGVHGRMVPRKGEGPTGKITSWIVRKPTRRSS